MTGAITGAVGGGPAPVAYDFYLDVYGGTLSAEALAEAMPAALRCVAGLTGRRAPDPAWGEAPADAWRRRRSPSSARGAWAASRSAASR